MRNAVAALPACVPTLSNTVSTPSATASKLLAELASAVLSADVPVLTAPVRLFTLPSVCLSWFFAVFALLSAMETKVLEPSSRCCALWVSVPNVFSVVAVSASVVANSPMLPLNCVSCVFASGLSSCEASCEAISSAVPVSVSENISLICAATVSAP